MLLLKQNTQETVSVVMEARVTACQQYTNDHRQHNQPPGSYRNSVVLSNCCCLFAEDENDEVQALETTVNTRILCWYRDFKVLSLKKNVICKPGSCHTSPGLQVSCHFVTKNQTARKGMTCPWGLRLLCRTFTYRNRF